LTLGFAGFVRRFGNARGGDGDPSCPLHAARAGSRLIAEAAPRDPNWGVGLAVSDPAVSRAVQNLPRQACALSQRACHVQGPPGFIHLLHRSRAKGLSHDAVQPNHTCPFLPPCHSEHALLLDAHTLAHLLPYYYLDLYNSNNNTTTTNNNCNTTDERTVSRPPALAWVQHPRLGAHGGAGGAAGRGRGHGRGRERASLRAGQQRSGQ